MASLRRCLARAVATCTRHEAIVGWSCERWSTVSTPLVAARRRVPSVALGRPQPVQLGRRLYATSRAPSDPYKVLGVPKNATEDDIKKAYRKKALEWHPDRQPPEKRKEAEEKFSEATGAYEILSDPQKRRHYDTLGQAPDANFHQGGGFPSTGPHHQPTFDEAMRMFREAFGADIFHPFQQEMGGGLSVGAKVTISRDHARVLQACRECGIDSTNDGLRRKALGREGKILKIDNKDRTVKVDVPGVGAVWFATRAVQPRDAINFPGGFGAFAGSIFGDLGAAGFGNGAGGGGGGPQAVRGKVVEQRQEMVERNGRKVMRITQVIELPDGSRVQQVSEIQAG